MNKLDWGVLQPWIDDDAITDINCNGQSVWVDHLKKGRFEVEGIQRDQLVTLSYRIANFVNESFNQVHPLIEAETSDLRISLIHESLSKSGHALSIRKTPRVQRLTRKQILLDEYMPKHALDFLEQAIHDQRNIMVCGLPGAGKTELVKYLMGLIPSTQRVITIEDSLELRYLDIHPSHDGVSLKVKANFSYVDAIKASLRQRPDWIMVSEVRSLEVMHLIESATTGTHIMSTIHAENASSIPRRMLAMANLDAGSAPILHQNIHEILDLGIRVEAKQTKKGIERFVAEIVGFDVVDNQVVSQVLYRVGDKTMRSDFAKFQKGKGGLKA